VKLRYFEGRSGQGATGAHQAGIRGGDGQQASQGGSGTRNA